jgi:hypothetical protein
MNVHRGEGAGDHDDCRAEALLMSCPGGHGHSHKGNDNPNPNPNSRKNNQQQAQPPVLKETLQQVLQMAKERPNFWQDLRDQWDRDLNSQVKDIIVAHGTDGERSKKLLRARNVIVPWVERLDRIEMQPQIVHISILLVFHLAVAIPIGIMGWIGFVLALAPKYGLLTESTQQLADLHNATLLCSLHMALLLLVLLLRRLVYLINRKSNVLDQFLRSVLKLETENDLGISVHGFAQRAQLWIHRITISSSVISLVVLGLWQSSQPTAPAASLYQPTCELAE